MPANAPIKDAILIIIYWYFDRRQVIITCLYDPALPGTKITGAPENFISRAASVKRPSEYANKLYFGNLSFSRKLIFYRFTIAIEKAKFK